MAWFVRVIELDEAHWACRHGETEFDVHASLSAALTHAEALASERSPASVVVHHADGRIDHL